MRDQTTLERRYRRLLAWFPREFQREQGEEILSVLMAGARNGQRRPGLVASAAHHTTSFTCTNGAQESVSRTTSSGRAFASSEIHRRQDSIRRRKVNPRREKADVARQAAREDGSSRVEAPIMSLFSRWDGCDTDKRSGRCGPHAADSVNGQVAVLRFAIRN